MRKLALTLVTVAAFAASAGTATAKEMVKATFCGASGCASVTDRQTLRRLPAGGETLSGPAAPGPFYTVRFTSRNEGQTTTWRIYYVPSGNVLAAPGEYGQMDWFPIWGKPSQSLMRRLTKGLVPFPAPRVTSVAIGSKVLRDGASSYLRLYDVESAGPAVPGTPDWVPITLRSGRPSPWTDPQATLLYSPSTKVLQRGTEFVKLPDGVASSVEAADPLRPTGDGGFTWLAVVLPIAGVAVLAGAAVVVVRLRRRAAVGRLTTA
jgi:hypothetical protein